jgi:hypothetical protein
MINWLSRWFRHDGALTEEQVAKEITNIALYGLLRPESRAAQRGLQVASLARGIGSCRGGCPDGGFCTLCASCGGCGCLIPCSGGSGAPTCDGTCPPTYTCVYDSIDGFCACGH